jgi:small subunit ribosomal protein S1
MTFNSKELDSEKILEENDSSSKNLNNSRNVFKRMPSSKQKVLFSMGDNRADEFFEEEDREDFYGYFKDALFSCDNVDITNKILEGIIRKIKGNDIIVDIGLKNYARLNKDELRNGINNLNPRIGEKIKVVAESREAKYSPYIKSSWEKARRIELWDQFEEFKKNKNVISGSIQSETRGGYIANIMGVKAFIPGSHVDFRPPEKDVLEKMKSQEQQFIIVSMDKNGNKSNIVVSRREVLNLERMKVKDKAIKNIKVGDVYCGVVKTITQYGYFIDLEIPGCEDSTSDDGKEACRVDGLLHVNDTSWFRISNPSDVLSVGSKVNVVVISLSPEDRKISLGMKQLTENPWKGLSERLVVGSKVKGIVKSHADYGYFVSLPDSDVEGLVHNSEISWFKQNAGLSIGQEVEVMVLFVDEEKARVSLSIKQCLENPWQKFADKHKINDIIKVKIKKVVEFGCFVDLENGIEGLVHISDLSSKQEDTQRILFDLKTDETISVKILSMDVNKGRVALGLKQVQEDPFLDFLKSKNIGDILKVKINNQWNEKLEILIQEANLILYIDKLENLPEDFEAEKQTKYLKDSEMNVKILELDPSIRKIVLTARV